MTQNPPIQRIPPTQDYIPAAGHASPEAEASTAAAASPGPPDKPGGDRGGDSFVHLHVHSNFSFLDGGSRIEELAARAASLGQSALALTDHDGLYGAMRFAKACAKFGIKPIFGAELRVESLLDGEAADDPHHLVLLAETREGYANLCRLISAAHLADEERKKPPLVTLESLCANAEGLICLTGCRHGQVGALVDAGRDQEARAALLRLREIFGPTRLYVELQYFRYQPHQEAYAGQRGTDVYHKAPAVGGRLRHRPLDYPPSKQTTPSSVDSTSSTNTAVCMTEAPPSSTKSRLGTAFPTTPPPRPFPPDAASTNGDSHVDTLHAASSATLVASWRRGKATRELAAAATGGAVREAEEERPDLPRGAPQRLNPADYDVGFHRDGRPWRLSCLAYCERLARLAAEVGVPVVLTTNAHYAGPEGRDLHLVVRAAGRDQPLSDYPEAVAGHRCLKAGAELAAFAAPLLELVGEVDPLDSVSDWCEDWAPSEYGVLHCVARATRVACMGEGPLVPPLDATAEIAARCNVDLELGVYHFPQVELVAGETAYSLLAQRCFAGMATRYKPVPMEAVALLEKELRVIEEMGFAHYFLVVHDIVRWARAQGIACSGRGSAGNSIVCHVLDITASDPIRHHLLFERFLNPNRREMPDIDVDFCSTRRDEVIEHIYKTFGEKNVAIVANVNTASPRSAVRIVAEALGFAPTEINALAKHVPRHGDAARLREYLDGGWPELRDSPLQDCTPGGRYARLVDLAERLDGFPLHLGTHLGGFVIADKPITHYAPLQWAAKGVVVLQFNKDDVAALGLVKMDILGLRTHSAVSECVHLIRQRTGRGLSPYELPPDDPAAFEIISNGGSIGLFQLESAGQRNLASRLKERDFDDVIAAIALYRPGPLEAEMITPFIDRRWGLEQVTLPHPSMAEAVADTYGVILYQEQVLRIARDVAGFDLADADSLRRTMTRDRSREEMAKIGHTFISRAIARGVPAEAAREVFRQLQGFAAYGFNKSHSVCFAVISYATAWLKAHYPAEFLCAVLNNQPMGFYTPRTVLNDARRFGLAVRPLDVNLSGRGFTVEDKATPEVWNTAGEATPYNPFAQAWTAEHGWGLNEEADAGCNIHLGGEPHGDTHRAGREAPPDGAAKALRVGFSYLKQMSERALDRIEEERRHGPFTSFEDFYLRTRVEQPVAENLIRVGAFDSLEPDRTGLLWRLPLLHDRLEALAGSSGQRRGQLRAFFCPPCRAGLERQWSLEDKVRTELDLLGLSVSCHPLQLYEEELRRIGVVMSNELEGLGNEVPVTVAGVYERAQNPWMRSGHRTMFLTLEDAYGLFECVCFESKLPQIAPVVARASYFLVRGRLQNNHKRGLAIVAEEVRDLEGDGQGCAPRTEGASLHAPCMESQR